MLIQIILCVSSLIGAISSPLNSVSQDNLCAIQKCHPIDSNKINVHLISHSHDDVGWLKTVEEYYYGRNDSIQNVGVQYIFDSVLQALTRKSDRRYIQVETAFFWKWWNRQNKNKQQLFKSFVDNGQIEMVGGGWSMNDEACTNYQSTINQFTWGLRLLNDTLGECGRPKIGWQIDPFGHSKEQASIFKQMGYNAVFFVRLSKSSKDERIKNKDLEFLWKSNDDLDDSEIFTSIFSTDSYYAPSGFCWDYLQCDSDAINDDVESFDYNLDSKVESFSEYIANYSKYYKTNNILFAMGGDFQYQSAEINYMNIDKLIKGFENNENYSVFYSTPSCYYKAVSEAKPNLTVTTTDFFPYAENNHTFWSGFYTSRATIKRFERTGNNILQASEHLNAFAKMRDQKGTIDYENNVKSLREVMGTLQHHDAVTGTEKQHVAEDYARILTKAIKETEEPIGKIIGNLLKKEDVSEDVVLPVSSCLLTNITICENSLKDKFMVTVYNPLSRYVTYYVRLPAWNSTYKITGADGEEAYDILNHMKYPANTSTPSTDVELIFAARDIPPMGIKYYYVQKLAGTFNANHDYKEKDTNEIIGDSSNVVVALDGNNLLSLISMNGKTARVSQKFMAYISNNGTGDHIASGAYLFRPINGSDAFNIDYYYGEDQVNETTPKKIPVTTTRGNVVDEIVQVFNDWLTQTIRVYKAGDDNFVEFDWIVGPLDNKTVETKNNYGREIITRFYVNDLGNDLFYTDSNGRQMIERKRNNYPYNDSTVEPVTSNYFPVTSRITIQDGTKDLRVTVLNDRSQGGSSLWDGEIELMVHRRTLRDDSKGLDETLEEIEFGNYVVVRGQHYLVLGSTASTTNGTNEKSTLAQERELALKKLLQPWVLVGDATSDEWTLDKITATLNFQWSGLKSALPDNVNILTLEPWKEESYILRLEHIMAKDEDSNYSKEVTVDISDIFSPYTISSIRETTLGANDWLSDTKSSEGLKGETDNVYVNPSLSKHSTKIADGETEILLTPMQIRTFIVEFSQ